MHLDAASHDFLARTRNTLPKFHDLPHGCLRPTFVPNVIARILQKLEFFQDAVLRHLFNMERIPRGMQSFSGVVVRFDGLPDRLTPPL